MELLFVILIAALVVCIVLAFCVFCCKFCRCGESAYADYEESGPTKVTTTSSSKELSRSEYYSDSTPILRSSQPSHAGTDGHQSTPLLSSYPAQPPAIGFECLSGMEQSKIRETTHTTSHPPLEATKALYHQTLSNLPYPPNKQIYSLDKETNKTTYFASPSSRSSTSGTSYSSARNFYPLEPTRHETAYSERTTSYSSENTVPYQVTAKTSYAARQPSQLYSEGAFQQTEAPQNSLKRSSSQTSLYENN